ncbi:hypothetical protein [Cupriavidus agavae]|uniref:Uncharacterized protein n=1 Tax=Cupriavidus agavae TaxID=1001822 RepID=A0A4Q7S1J2_9BURK|nr:hypothetical protein [Cupriavidus agavae]RZT39338.1 hypothetical protein EV147_2533 [Cupriavidus agavae]
MKKATKKKYLKALNSGLQAELGKDAGAKFVFHPAGARSKDATGVTASEGSDAQTLEAMERVQARVFAEFSAPEKRRRSEPKAQ